MTKTLAAIAVLLGLAFTALAEEPDDSTVERQRIQAARVEADAAFASQERACYGKFAVNDCLDRARAQRRASLADLRRREISLNDAERRRRAAERLQDLERRNSTEAAGERRVRPPAAQRQREPREQGESTGSPASEGLPAAGGRGQDEAARMKQRNVERDDKAQQAEEKRKHHQERLAQAEERRAKLERKRAERTKPPAKPLPVPP